jgi:alkylhydroperoxidase/carboxymuconolactone decarboxylase family protein YurZ
MAAAAAVKGHDALMRRELGRAGRLGLSEAVASGAAVAVLISRGEAVYERFREATWELFGRDGAGEATDATGISDTTEVAASADAALAYFEQYFGSVPDYVTLMAERSPRALEGYMLMRKWALDENALEPKLVELLLCTVNAAEFGPRFVKIHARGARRAGASEEEIVEAVLCAIPVAGVASWLPGAEGVLAGD